MHFDATDKSQTAGVSVAYEHKYATFNARVYVPISVQLLDFAKDIANQDTRADLDLVFKHPDYKFVAGAQTKVTCCSLRSVLVLWFWMVGFVPVVWRAPH